jgi:hypothetical protein
MEHPGKEAPLCSPNGKTKDKCVAGDYSLYERELKVRQSIGDKT